MSDSPTTLASNEFSRSHRLILDFLQKLSDDELHWNMDSRTHSIAWHAWHLARWADYLQASIPGMTPELSGKLAAGAEVWHMEKVAARWGLNGSELGFDETGMYMTDEAALAMVFPTKVVFLEYIAQVFATAERVIGTLNDAEFVSKEQVQPMTEPIFGEGTVGSAVLEHISHANRHLGMMECLLGLQGRPGTATQ
jgi:hypothetical protein